MPDAAALPHNLRCLFLSENRLTGPIPASIAEHLTKLEHLGIASNHLSGLIPPSMGSLKRLKQLTLGDNQLSGVIPQCVEGMTDLEMLVLWENRLTGCAATLDLSPLSKLVILNLSTNPLKHKARLRTWLDLQLSTDCQLYT